MTLSPTALEEAAKVLCRELDDTWKDGRAYWTSVATAAITAYLAQMEKEGWVMVPVEPTGAMVEAGDEVMYGRYGCSFEVTPIYTEMLAAAQNGGE